MVLLLAALTAPTALADESGFDHDHATFDRFLDGAVSSSGVDYGALASRRALLDSYLADVASAPVSEFSKTQQLALYVNAYNAYTVKTILDEMPLKSIMDLDGGKVWDKRTFAVAGSSSPSTRSSTSACASWATVGSTPR